MIDAEDTLHELIARIPPDIAGIANAWATKLPDLSKATVIAIALMIDREQQLAEAITREMQSEAKEKLRDRPKKFPTADDRP